MYTIGLDIGGANVKAADVDGRALTHPFSIWKSPGTLGAVLSDVLSHFAPAELLAVTMTAELADCFETKADGVDSILQSIEEVAGATPLFVWQTGAEFVTPSVARDIPMLVAAANWHALATWAGRLVPEGAGLLIDVGTTTTDIIPLLRGVAVPSDLTDRDRLESGELVYSGVGRTPICALANSVPFRGGECPLAAEFFATTLDIYLLLGLLPEDVHNTETANGKPATLAHARTRLARMLCCDASECTQDEMKEIARFLADVQQQQIRTALERVLGRQEEECRVVLLSGSGSFLAERIISDFPPLLEVNRVALEQMRDRTTSQAACAFAVACLAAERLAGVVR
jgi:hypothetical protein